jgi:hypothetical protein
VSGELKPNLEPAVRVFQRRVPLAILNRDEHVLFHRMLTQRLIGIKHCETKRGTVTQMQLDQAVEIARLQQKIEHGLAGDMDILADAEQRLRLMLAEEPAS